MNAYEAILEALIARGAHRRRRRDLRSRCSTPWPTGWPCRCCNTRAASRRKRIGLAHTSIAPYGAFKSRDGVDVLISIQNDREWRVLAEEVLGDPALAADPSLRHQRRTHETARRNRRKSRRQNSPRSTPRRSRKSSPPPTSPLRGSTRPAELAHHPHLRRITIGTPHGPVSYPAPAEVHTSTSRRYGAVPALGEHTEKVRAEFMS